MRSLALLVGLLWAVGGIGADLPPPVIFAHEPVEVVMEGGPPRAFHGARPYELRWDGTALPDGRTRWAGTFPTDAPLGPWYLDAGAECISFLRVPDDRAILIARGAAGMRCSVGAGVRVADGTGTCWFVLDPGTHVLTAEFPAGGRVTRELDLAPGERRTVTLVSLEFSPTASAALPGRPFLVVARVLSPVDLPEFRLTAELPAGWAMRIRGPCLEALPCALPVYAGTPAELELVLEIPADAAGPHEIPIHIPSLGIRETLTVEVRGCLDPREVVRHWCVGDGDLDLSRGGGVTYERLLWAIAHLGKRVPFACRSLTRADLDVLIAEWEGGG
ncbi:MAG: hypothetical protein GXO72_01775 [Caldiserica bacterium]|nr:hypothetical protein [Caldisericota bacterium]